MTSRKIPFEIWQFDKALNSVRLGATRLRALRAAGIRPGAMQEVQRRADEGEKRCARLLDQLDEAEAQAEVKLVEAIAGTPSAKDKAFLLERRFSGDWSQKLSLEITRELQRMIGTAERILPPEYFEKLLKALAEPELTTPPRLNPRKLKAV